MDRIVWEVRFIDRRGLFPSTLSFPTTRDPRKVDEPRPYLRNQLAHLEEWGDRNEQSQDLLEPSRNPCQPNVAHQNGVQKRTCPKLRDNWSSWISEGCMSAVPPRVVSVVHTHILKGTSPTDMKNMNGNRRLMVLLFVKCATGQAGSRQFSEPNLPYCRKLWPVSLPRWPNLFPRQYDRDGPRNHRNSRGDDRPRTNQPS